MSNVINLGTGGGGGGGGILTITGNIGGPVGPDVGQNINIVGGGGTTVTGNAGLNTLTITSTGVTWNETTTATVNLAANNGYVMNRALGVTGTLPAVAAVGDTISIVGKGTGGWLIAQNAGQTIHFGEDDSATGIGGSLFSTKQYDCVELVCITANTDFVVRSSMGNLGVTQ
jgi:hypothetical protein